MLNHKWMPKRDRSIRRPAQGGDDPLAVEADGLGDEPDAGPVVAAEAQSQEGQDMSLAQAPAGPEATIDQAIVGPDQVGGAVGGSDVITPAPGPGEALEAALPEASEPPGEPEPDLPASAPDGVSTLAAPQAADARESRPAERRDARTVAEKLHVPQASLRDRLESVLSHQAQLPLDIDARHAVSAGAEGSPRETRELLLQRLLDPTLTLQEAATLLGVCTTTIRRYTDRGLLRCFRTPGNQRRFHLSDVLDFMERQQQSR